MIFVIIIVKTLTSVLIHMNGELTKYYKYDSSGSGSDTIPIALAKALNWEHQDEIGIIIDVKNDNKGLFLFKK